MAAPEDISRATTSIMAPDLLDLWAETATTKVGSPAAAAGPKDAATADGSAIPRAIPKFPVAGGITRVTARAAGTETPRVTRRLLAEDGTIPAMAKAAGMATQKAIPKHRAGAGNKATKATTGAVHHVMTTTTAGTRAAAAAVTGTTTATMSAAATAPAAMAAGPAIRKPIRRLRVAAGKTVADQSSSANSTGTARRKLG